VKPLGPLLFAAAIVAVSVNDARGQMFGQRQLGGMLSRQSPAGTMNNPASSAVNNPGGQINGAERFVRGTRQATDFVGTDTGDRRGFVGQRQSRNRRPSLAALTLQPRPEPKDTQAAAQVESNSSTSLYQPRLVIDPELIAQLPPATASKLEAHLAKCPAIQATEPLAVSVEGRTAVLQGVVASERDRELAAALVLFEPGISDVRNDLQVKSPAPTRSPRVTPEFLEPAPARRPAPAARLPREF
jgi:BON domain-containing protein